MKSAKEERKKKRDESDSEDGSEQGNGSENENGSDEDDDKKWDYLEHKGVTFNPPYLPNKTKVKYDGELIQLSAEEEELLLYWYGSRNSAQFTNVTFRNNFQKQFMKRYEGKQFQKFDFTSMYEYFDNSTKEKSNNEALKQEAKIRKAEEDKKYGYALVNNLVQKLGAHKIQIPTLLKGRGEHPLAGVLKARIYPEDVTINIARNAPIPICPMKGHCWKEIVHKEDVTWLASYKDTGAAKSHKYIYLAPNSVFKYTNDVKKYEKARNLKKQIERIRKDYTQKLQSSDLKNQQLGTATYLIDTLALRVGNEKGQDEADTVGCCSLRVQHVNALPGNQIALKFLGKDSIEYNNTVKVTPAVHKNIISFLSKKAQSDDMFEKINAQDLNDYLRGLMEGLTAKVFRTYNASTTLQNQLNRRNYQGMTMEQKKEQYEDSIKQVAILCNHQKTVSKKSEEGLKKLENELLTKQTYVEELKAHLEQFKGRKKPTRVTKTVKLESGKDFKMQFPEDKDQTNLLLEKEITKLAREQKNLKKRMENKQIATGTSKTNYNDPRISVAWCKKNEVKIEKVFNKALLTKFFWAMSIESDFQF